MILSTWLSILDPAQRSAWSKLCPKHREQYLQTGVVRLEVVKMKGNSTEKMTAFRVIEQSQINDVSISYIVSKINHVSSEKWDYNAIDWGST